MSYEKINWDQKVDQDTKELWDLMWEVMNIQVAQEEPRILGFTMNTHTIKGVPVQFTSVSTRPEWIDLNTRLAREGNVFLQEKMPYLFDYKVTVTKVPSIFDSWKKSNKEATEPVSIQTTSPPVPMLLILSAPVLDHTIKGMIKDLQDGRYSIDVKLIVFIIE